MRIWFLFSFMIVWVVSPSAYADELGGSLTIEELIKTNGVRQDGEELRVPIPSKRPKRNEFGKVPVPTPRPKRGGIDFNAKPPYTFKTEYKWCNKNYITKDGQYGPMAKSLINRFKHMSTGKKKAGEPSPAHFKRFFKVPSNSISKSCSKYNSMNSTDRMHFWIWVMTSISMVESGCGINGVKLDDVNGQSLCDFQLPNKEMVKKDKSISPSWRGPGCDIENDGRAPKPDYTWGKLSKTKYEMSNDDTCAACAVEVLGKNICGFHSGDSRGKRCSDPPLEKIFGPQMFWNEMKKDERKIISQIKKYPGCK